MLSPNNVAPTDKAGSIYSFDSGYGSNTPEDDESVQGCSERYSPAEDTNTEPLIGLGISISSNVHIRDQLRLSRSGIPVTPITTKLNVFTTHATFQDHGQRPLPHYGSGPSACVTCQLWDITNPGQGLKCDNCRNKDLVKPPTIQRLDTKLNGKLAVPRLVIPHEPPRSFPSCRPKTRCSACDLAAALNPGASSTCSSCTPDPDFLSPISPVQPSTVKRSCARRAGKLPAHALVRLRDWLENNRDNPYPTPETKQMLAHECQITEKQVTTWFTNTRARKLALPKDRSYPSSDDDGVYESDFSSVTNTPVICTSEHFTYGAPLARQHNSSFAGPSNTDSAKPQVPISRRGKKKDYRRMNTLSPIDNSPVPRTPATPSPSRDGAEQELWQCTFCYQSLAPKSWRRHEETQHRPKFHWTCLATGPRLMVPSRTGTYSICAFCHIKNPSDDHFFHSHRIMDCKKKPESERSFGRPDHLRQHVKNFHKASLKDDVRAMWKRNGSGQSVNEPWTCGFCAQELKTWDARETHIANHFKIDRYTMATWKDYSQPASATPSNSDIQQLPDVHQSLFTKMQRTLSGLSNSQPRQQRQQTPSFSTFSNTFAPLPVSTGYSNPDTIVQAGPSQAAIDTCMPDPLMNNFDFMNPSINFDPGYMESITTYDPPMNDGSLPLDLDDINNTELFGNFIDYQGVWDQE